MRKHNAREETTKGKCNLCGGIFSKAAMAEHLASCMKARNLAESKKTRKINAFHIMVEGADRPEYWMHLEVNANATLKDLDDFLRKIWLECCGHLSAFRIQGTSYLGGPDEDDEYLEIDVERGERNMKIPLEDVLAPNLRFYHEYDFGTTTELVLKVISEHEKPFERMAVRILARNEPPERRCSVCGKVATKVCPMCVYEGKGWLCDACSRKHPCGKEVLLPVVNSPRVGMCGYTG